ncbi:MAG: DNA-binding response regulator [Bacteroidetes bacterium]|nr:MAG: DNA-binding response regulator [Bacteroidota bacterium]
MKSELIKAIIVEDEPLARSGLEGYVKEVDFIELVASCENAFEANNVLARHQPDLMFLDIQMPRLTGIDFLKSISHPPMVIMTTAYPNYALQGFELDVVDYLVKPYPFDRFLKAANKARDLFMLRSEASKPNSPVAEFMFVKTDSRLEKVVFREILYVEAMENYVIIHTPSQKIITMMTMKAMEESLPGNDFLRIHKSYIANKRHILSIEGNQIQIGHTKIPVSRNNKSLVMERLLGKQ